MLLDVTLHLQVREGLWKTEKALADLEMRQYQHNKERAANLQQHTGKFETFKQQMEVSYTAMQSINVT